MAIWSAILLGFCAEVVASSQCVGDGEGCSVQAGALLQVNQIEGVASWIQKGARHEMLSALKFVKGAAEAAASRNWTGHSTNLSATEQNALSAILSFIDGLAIDMVKYHEEDQRELDRMIGIIGDCRANAVNSLAGPVENKRIGMRAANATHHACRKAADELGKTKSAECTLYTTYRRDSKVAIPPSCMTDDLGEDEITTDDPDILERMHACLVRAQQWLPPLHELYQKCATATEVHVDKIEECKGAQASFEIAFCSYEENLEGTCQEQSRCHQSGVDLWDETKVDVAVSETARKADHEVSKKIKCLVGVFHAPNGEKTSTLDECRDLTVDTSEFDLVYAQYEEKVSCVEEVNEPCAADWLAAEYSTLWFDYLKSEEMGTCSACAA